MKRVIRLFSITLVLALVLTTFGGTAFGASDTTFDNTKDAMAYFQEQFLKVNPDISFTIKTKSKINANGFMYELENFFDEDDADDFNVLADYYLWSMLKNYNISYSMYSSYSNYTYNFTMSIEYSTTYEQEKEFEAKLITAMESLKLDGKTEYEKVKAIYDYICSNVTYDYSLTRYTAYNALCEGKAVCQGYACLLYRMCKAAGIPVRIVTGMSSGVPHAWNIVKIGSYYYNVDSTWDAGSYTKKYFLKTQFNFPDHRRDFRYKNRQFDALHPMAPIDYFEFLSLKPVATVKKVAARSIKISWNKVEGSDGYVIYRSTTKDGTYKMIKSIESGDITFFTNKKLTKGKRYYYRVQAYDTINNVLIYSDLSVRKSVKL